MIHVTKGLLGYPKEFNKWLVASLQPKYQWKGYVGIYWGCQAVGNILGHPFWLKSHILRMWYHLSNTWIISTPCHEFSKHSWSLFKSCLIKVYTYRFITHKKIQQTKKQIFKNWHPLHLLSIQSFHYLTHPWTRTHPPCVPNASVEPRWWMRCKNSPKAGPSCLYDRETLVFHIPAEVWHFGYRFFGVQLPSHFWCLEA